MQSYNITIHFHYINIIKCVRYFAAKSSRIHYKSSPKRSRYPNRLSIPVKFLFKDSLTIRPNITPDSATKKFSLNSRLFNALAGVTTIPFIPLSEKSIFDPVPTKYVFILCLLKILVLMINHPYHRV